MMSIEFWVISSGLACDLISLYKNTLEKQSWRFSIEEQKQDWNQAVCETKTGKGQFVSSVWSVIKKEKRKKMFLAERLSAVYSSLLFYSSSISLGVFFLFL